jgi:hypothetical protein
LFGCGIVVRSGMIAMVRGVKLPSSGGVVVMRIDGVTTLHFWVIGKPKPPPLEAMLILSVEFSRMVCNDGDLLRAIPMKMAPESFHLLERLRLSTWSSMNSRLPQRIVLPRVKLTLVWCLPLVTMMSFSE